LKRWGAFLIEKNTKREGKRGALVLQIDKGRDILAKKGGRGVGLPGGGE